MKYLMVWLLHERTLLMGGSMFFALIVLYLVRVQAPASAVEIFSGILGAFTGALLRGITSTHHEDDSQHM